MCLPNNIIIFNVQFNKLILLKIEVRKYFQGILSVVYKIKFRKRWQIRSVTLNYEFTNKNREDMPPFTGKWMLENFKCLLSEAEAFSLSVSFIDTINLWDGFLTHQKKKIALLATLHTIDTYVWLNGYNMVRWLHWADKSLKFVSWYSFFLKYLNIITPQRFR